ncbi:MAG: PQQ-binding-like beta-propeller repeat protein [Vulcanimicrobiota bacterium]
MTPPKESASSKAAAPKKDEEKCPLCSGFHKKGARFCSVTGKEIFRRKCPICGKEVLLRKPDSRFCPLCGKDMGAICPYEECKAPFSKRAPFCRVCRKKIIYCMYCNSANNVGNERCFNCDTPLPEVTGQWPLFKGDLSRTGTSNEALQFPLYPKWSFPDKGDVKGFAAAPIVWRGTLYIGDIGGNLYALNQYNGEQIWSRPVREAIVSSPAIDNDTVYVATMEGKIYAVGADSGGIRWVYPKALGEKIASVESSLLVDTMHVYGITLAGEVFALNRETGEPVWWYKEHAVPLQECGSGVSPALSGNTLVVAVPDGHVVALRADTGERQWLFPGDAPLSSPVCGTPSIWKNLVYAADRSGRIYALRLDTGEDSWHFSTQVEGAINSSLALGGGYLFVGTWAAYFYCLDVVAGGVKWRFRNERITVWDAISSTPFVLENQAVIFGTHSGYLYALDMQGQEIWSYRLEKEVLSSPVVSDGFVYVIAQDGFLSAFYPRIAQKG